jgi:hypothetical protein
MDYQGILNALILVYGLLLAVAHYNLRGIQEYLLKQYETEKLEEALEALARENDNTIIERIKGEFRFPLIASPYLFALQRISRRGLIRTLGKKHKIPQQRLQELLVLEKRGTQVKEL